MDRWAARQARLDDAIDRTMAESVRIVPVVEGDFSGALPDPSRDPLPVVGTLWFLRGETDMGGNAANRRNAQVTTARADLQIRKSLIPAGYEIRKDDRVEVPAQGLVFKIDRIDRQHPGRLALMLSVDASQEIAP